MGADINYQDENGLTALQYAVQADNKKFKNNKAMIEFLQEQLSVTR